MPLLAVESLSRRYGGEWFGAERGMLALAGVSFEMADGEILGIVGESGSGKSTLARLVAALDRPTGGRVMLAGDVLQDLSPTALRLRRRDVQMVFQDPQGSLDPRRTIGSSIAEPLHCLAPRPNRAARRARVADRLAAVGLDPAMARLYPHQMSGGQRQRVAIARALVTEPRLIVADEPTSALDLSVQAQILDLFLALNHERGTAILFISHNLAAVGAVAERVAVMYRGRIVELGPAARLLTRPRHPYTVALLAAAPSLEEILAGTDKRVTRAALSGDDASPASGCAFRLRCPHAAAICAAEVPDLRMLEPAHAVACHRPVEARI